MNGGVKYQATLLMTFLVWYVSCGGDAKAGHNETKTSVNTSFTVTGIGVDLGRGRVYAKRVKVTAESGVRKVTYIIFYDSDNNGERDPNEPKKITNTCDNSGYSGPGVVGEVEMTGGEAEWNAGQGTPMIETTVEFNNGITNSHTGPVSGSGTGGG